MVRPAWELRPGQVRVRARRRHGAAGADARSLARPRAGWWAGCLWRAGRGSPRGAQQGRLPGRHERGDRLGGAGPGPLLLLHEGPGIHLERGVAATSAWVTVEAGR